MAEIQLAQLSDIPEGEMVCRTHGPHQVLLAKVAGAVYCLNDVCTHAGAPLHEGTLGREGDCMVTCPWHDAHFDLRTGGVDQDTPWGHDTDVYPVRIEGEAVWVTLPD